MAKIREEIVGKRFLSVSKSSKLKLSKVSQWDWRAGVIRACTHADTKHPELQILVEYEDVSWERREWIHVHKDQAFQILLVEHTLVLAPRTCWPKLRGTSGLCPALIFNALVDDVGLSDTKERPVEYLVDKALEFHDYATVKNYQEGECVLLGGDESEEAVRRWVAEQDGQRILCTTPSVLVGFRVQVYRSEGTTQWYTAVIVGYNDTTRELTVTDDTVLEEHSEDPSLVHIRLLGEGVVESILRGENVGITPRRSRSGVNNLHATGLRHNRRETVTSLRGRKTCPTSKVPTPLTSPLLGQSPPSPARSSSPTSPRFPLTNSLKHHTVIQTSSENQPSNEEKLQELSNFNRIFHPITKTSPPSIHSDSSLDGKGSVFFSDLVTHKEANHPPKYLSNTNTLNSPSSPTNPDKPTNPRKETIKSADSKLAVSSQVENPAKGTTKNPASSSATVCSTEKRKQVSSIPEVKDNQIISENRLEESKKESYSFVSSTCSVNSSLKKVIIKVKNNLQLINPPSSNEVTKFKDKEPLLKVSSDLNSGGKIKERTDVLKVKDDSNVNTAKVTDKSDSENSQVIDKSSLNDKKVTGKTQLLETKVKDKSDLDDSQVADKVHSIDSKVKNCDSNDKENLSESKLLSTSNVDTTLKLKIDFSDSKKTIRSEISESKPANKDNLKNSEVKHEVDLSDSKLKVKSELSNSKNDFLPSDTELSVVTKTASDTDPPKKQLIVDSGRQVDVLQQLNNNNDQFSANLESKPGVESKKECIESAKKVISDSEVAIKDELPRDDRLDKEKPVVRDCVDKVTADKTSSPNSSRDVKTLFDVTPLTNGKLRPIPVLYHSSTSIPSENKPSVPDFLKVKNSNSHRQVILLSSEGLKIEGAKSEEPSDKKSHSLLYPSIDLVKSTTDINSLTVTPTSLVVGDISTNNIDVASRLLNTDCTLSLSRVEDSTTFQVRSPLPNDDLSIVSVTPTTVNSVEESSNNKVGASSLSPSGLRGSIHSSYSGGELAQSLAAAGAVSGRAVTITATSGPAPQGSSRVASPPSVSITAVVRSPNTFQPLPPQPLHHNPSESTAHHHDGVAAALHHPHPPSQPHLGSLTTARMDQGDGSSDSGVSVTERSVSRSSVLSDDRSSSAEVKPNTPTPTSTPVSVSSKTSLPPLIVDRKEAVKVWRNPAVLCQSELSVRHIHSLQHTAMSQHFQGVPPHIAPPGGSPAVTHQVSHPSAHGPLPPPASSMSHAMPQLHYPGPHGPPLHLTQGMQPSLSAAAALYPQLQQDVWKQLGHVAPLTPHHAAYAASLLPRHQEEFSYLEHQAREMEKQDRNQRERREAEAREKQIKEKMERERVERRKERERRERDERERSRRAEWGSEADLQLVNKHFEDSFRYAASQKHGRENLRQMPGETHPASVFYGQGLTNQQTPSTHLTHTQSLLISQQPQQLPQSQQPTHNKNFQPHSQGSPWGQNLGSLALKVDHRQPPSRHPPASQSSGEGMRKVKEPEQFVKDSIYNAFRSSDDPNNDPLLKSHNPPPAHSKHSLDKSSSMSGYPVPFGLKDHKSHLMDRGSYPLSHEKASVIVQPDLKYDKVAQLSVSPKQRPPERSSPYSSSSASGINHYKPYEPATPNRGSTPHHPSSLSPSPHSVELTKARQPVSSPHTVPAHADRYYPTGTKPPVSNPYQQNVVSPALVQSHLHNINTLPVKSKVSSPPLQMYGKPGITSGTPVCKMDTRPTPQPLPLTSKAPSLNGPPPAHLGSRNPEARPPPTPHEHRVSHNRSPFDTRLYSSSGASHPKTVTTSGVSPHPVPRIPTTSPHVLSDRHSPHQPTQTQPLDLGTRDGGSNSPNSRRRSLTPTPQDVKRPRLENVTSSPLLSRVSEPSPLYPTAATTITTVENTAAFAKLQRESSPVSSSPQSNLVSSIISKSSSVITNTPNALTNTNPSETEVTATLGGNPRPSSQPPPPSTTPNSVRAESNSPPSSTKQSEPEKCTSPGPAGAVGYVHKIKKAWLQRHKSGVEILPTNNGTNHTDNSSNDNINSNNNSNAARGSTPVNTSCSNALTPSTPISSTLKPDQKPLVRKLKPMAGLPNGHGQDGKEVDSTSTDSEDGSSLKMKRTKTKRNLKLKKGSESNSDSDKESDGSESSFKKSENLPMKQDTEPRRRRGRKPKIKAEKDDILKAKRPKEDPPNDPLQKPPVSQLKKTGESFLQDRSCYEVAPKLPKCRECRWTAQQRNKKMPNIFCRFYAFRRLRYTKNGQLAVAGFSNPVKDAFGEDLRLWVPDPNAPAPDLDCEMSKFLLTHVGDQFCDLVQQEKEAMALHMGDDPDAAWKRVVQGVREMCDVCETTLFNIHWACSKCGFVVCIDCYKGRKEGTVKVWDVEEGAKERDKYSWLLCASRVPHELDKLMLTQIIAGNALIDLGKKIHESRYKWSVPMFCGCPEANKYKEKEQEDKKLNGINKDLIKNMKKESKCDLVNGTVKLEKGERINGKDDDMSNSPLNFFADVALSNDKRESETSNSDSDSDSDGKEDQPSTLRELLTVRPSSKSSGLGKEESNNASSKIKEPPKKKAKLDTLDDVISCVIERGVDKDSKKDLMKVELKHFVRKYNYNRKGREPLPIRIMTKTESRLLYPNVPHSWLCDGKLLRLHDTLHKDNVTVFQDQWKRGQPVIVSGTGQSLNQDLWKPHSFAKDFGEVKNNLINCLTENIVPNQPMKKFWEGFEHYGKRLKDDKGQPMVLKLKDWPPGEDFAEMLPTRFDDLMRILPMGQYTRRNGSLNLAGRLPECFVRPDLGPKMYIAYGSASYPSKASTNLHLDISDAVNVMCYVGIPKDMDYEENVRETLKAIDEAGCDILTRQRVREKEEIPGALWHIYHARDADKIRDLLNKVAIERGKKLEPFHDPIHDQSWYLDGPLREKLYKEYAVEGYAIVQCMGDAVFIPAGAPHQVRNLQNCVKVAEDFVSPENISHCFHLTQEFRHLSDTHSNHEDKLQIKNIIYHAMKDAVATLAASEQRMEAVEVKEESKFNS